MQLKWRNSVIPHVAATLFCAGKEYGWIRYFAGFERKAKALHLFTFSFITFFASLVENYICKIIFSIIFGDLKAINLRTSASEIYALNSYFPPCIPSDLHSCGSGKVPYKQ